ncbi:MAG: hypothetical protein U5L96_20495 [Owenweeksia sp.]|nr:hypothetical protein [Owenweeksia sp.]
MNKAFCIALAICSQVGTAANTVFYDAINGTELTFTATSRLEKLAVDALNPVEEVDYVFFTFLNEEYEKQRIKKIHDRFKRRPLEASFKQKADSLARVLFQTYTSENRYYRNQEYEGYVVERISLSPVSYLGNTLTFSFNTIIKLKRTEDVKFGVEETYFLNLDDFSLLPARAIHRSVDYKALRKALMEKWQEIRTEMPRNNWAPLEEKVENEEDMYEEEYEVEEPQSFYTDSLITYAIQSADLRKAEIIYTGAGLLIVLHDAVPWFQSQYKEPLQVQMHLNAHEAKAALRDFKP